MVLRFLKQSFLFFIALIITFCFLEGIVRIFYPQKIVPNYHKPAFGIPNHLKANYQVNINRDGNFLAFKIETNQNRFRRSQDISYEKPPNTFRIMFLGDSLFFGQGVNNDELFTHHLENLLNQNDSGKRFEVINVSATGWGLLQFLTYFKNEGYKYSPEVVVVSSFSDDIQQNFLSYLDWNSLNYTDGIIQLKEAKLDLFHGSPIHTFMDWLGHLPFYEFAERRSQLLNVIRFRLSALTDTQKPESHLTSSHLNQFLKTINYKGYHSVTWKFDEFELNLPKFRNNPIEFFSGWQGSDPLMAEVNLPLFFFSWHQLFKSIRSAGAKPLVLKIPTHDEVLQLTGKVETIPFLKWFPGVSKLDLLEPLKDFQTHIPVSLLFPWDNHWSPAGHRLIAQLIYNFIAKPESVLFSEVSLQPKSFDIPEMTANLEQVNRHFKRILETSYYHLFLDGLRLKNQNQFNQAIHLLKRYLYLKPNDFEGHFQLGAIYMIMKNFDQALLHLKQAQSGTGLEQKKYQYTYIFTKAFGQAWHFFQEQHYKDALPFLDHAEKLQGVYLDKVYGLKANIFLRQNNLKKAKYFFEKAIAVNPDFFGYYQNLGKVYFDTGKLQKAVEAFKKSLRLSPESLEIYVLIFLINKQMGEIEKSHKWLQKFSKRCDNSCENLLREGFEAFFGGCDDSCKETLEEFKSHLLAVKPNP